MQCAFLCMARRAFLRRVHEGRCAAVLGDEIIERHIIERSAFSLGWSPAPEPQFTVLRDQHPLAGHCPLADRLCWSCLCCYVDRQCIVG
jgi:hypothetical protein